MEEDPTFESDYDLRLLSNLLRNQVQKAALQIEVKKAKAQLLNVESWHGSEVIAT